MKSEDLAVEGEPTQATALQGPKSRRKARPAAKLEEGTEPGPAHEEKRQKIAHKAQVQEGDAASGDRAAAKPKKAAQRKARAGQAVKTEAPDASSQQQEAATERETTAKAKAGRQRKVRAGQAVKAALPDVSAQQLEAAMEDAPPAKTKKGRQRKARAGLAMKAEMPEISCEQSVRSKAAAAPSRRKKRVDAGALHAALADDRSQHSCQTGSESRSIAQVRLTVGLAAMKRTHGTHVRCLPYLFTVPSACHVRAVYVVAGGDTEDILDGEIAIAELEEADIEEDIELVEITSVMPPGKLIGAHVSMSNGIARAVINAASIGKSPHDAFTGM